MRPSIIPNGFQTKLLVTSHQLTRFSWDETGEKHSSFKQGYFLWLLGKYLGEYVYFLSMKRRSKKNNLCFLFQIPWEAWIRSSWNLEFLTKLLLKTVLTSLCSIQVNNWKCLCLGSFSLFNFHNQNVRF